MKRLADYARRRAVGGRTGRANAADVDRRLRGDRFRYPPPPHVSRSSAPIAVELGQFGLAAYRDKRGRWQQAIVRYLDSLYPGLKDAMVASAFNTALSVGSISMRPTARPMALRRTRRSIGQHGRSPLTAVPGLYLASAYAGFGGYNGAMQAGGACADMILGEVIETIDPQFVLIRKRSVLGPRARQNRPAAARSRRRSSPRPVHRRPAPRRRAAAILHRPGHEDHRVACHRKLARAPLHHNSRMTSPACRSPASDSASNRADAPHPASFRVRTESRPRRGPGRD